MPSQLFVNSEDEDFDSGGEDGDSPNEDSDNDNNEDTFNTTGSSGEAVEDGDDGSPKGKKKKGKVKNAKVSKKAKKLGPKQPKGSKKIETLTKEEIKELTEKEYTQYSNLYNVQIEEVLEETSISEKKRENVNKWLEDFTAFVKSLPDSKLLRLEELEKHLKTVKIPIPSDLVFEKSEEKEKLVQWKAPSSVDIRGAWASNTALNKVSPVDVFIEMPYDYLVKSDFRNHRYHLKRAFYLAFVGKALEQRGDVVKFTLANGEYLRPVLSLQHNRLQILVHAVPPKDYFPLKKLSCDKNQLRYEHFYRKPKPEDEPDSSTQHYNFTILEDALVNENHEEVVQFLHEKQRFQNTIKLLKIWLTQRKLSKGHGGFSGFIVTQFLRYLSKIGKIHEGMTVFQMVRVFFINLFQMNLCEKGISFSSNDEAMREALMLMDVVFLDSTGLLNYTANMSKYTWRRVQEEARRSLAIIDGANVTGFTALFVTKVDFMMNFDHVIIFKKLAKLKKHFRERLEDQTVLLNHSGFIYPLVVTSVGALVEKCLGSRITALDFELPQIPEWNVVDKMPQTPEVVRLGLNINRETSRRLIEKCDSESEYAREKFNEFWGEKAELRRFKDGSLLQSVALENLVQGLGKDRICYQMISYILQRHLNYFLPQDDYIDQQLESMVESKYVQISKSGTPTQKKIFIERKLVGVRKVKPVVVQESVAVDHVTKYTSATFDELSKILRQLEELPLQISTVQGTSPVLRFSHIQPTPPQTYFQCKILTTTQPKKKALLLRRAPRPSAKKRRYESTKTADDNEMEVEEEKEEDEEMEEILNEEVLEQERPIAVPTKVPKFVEPVGVIIHLETSGKWPDNMEAIERLKCAFLIKIGELLSQKFGLTVQTYGRYLDVLKDGIVFRIKITYLRELTLLRQLRGPDGILRIRDNLESLRLEKETLILPQLTSTLHSFHLQYEAFGKTCRIAKRWVASQLLLSSPLEYNKNLEEPDCRLTEEALELLVAHLFLNFAPHLSYPSEAHVGFMRFLNLLANTDFRALPIILNFNEKLSSQDVSAIELEFVKMRTTLPQLFISTPFDRRGSVWTKYLSPVILGRLQLLAKQALTILEDHFGSSKPTSSETPSKIFKASTNQFDMIIKLKPKMNPRSYQNLDKIDNPLTFQKYLKPMEEYIPVVDFDPVQLYLSELRNAFGHLAIFLHDLFGGHYIAVVWKPEAFKACNFTSTSVKGRQLGRDGKTIVANVSGILESFEILGEGLVDEIQSQSDKWKFDD